MREEEDAVVVEQREEVGRQSSKSVTGHGDRPRNWQQLIGLNRGSAGDLERAAGGGIRGGEAKAPQVRDTVRVGGTMRREGFFHERRAWPRGR